MAENIFLIKKKLSLFRKELENTVLSVCLDSYEIKKAGTGQVKKSCERSLSQFQMGGGLTI